MRKYFLVGALLIGASTQAATIGLTAITVNGDKMVNDSVLGVTWADITPITTSGWAYPNVTYYSGSENFYGVTYIGSAQQWIDQLNLANYGGHNDWRLSTTNGEDNDHNCTSGSVNELGCLFFNELGTTFVGKVTNFYPFSNVQTQQNINNVAQTAHYWSGSEYTPGRLAWFFDAGSSHLGGQLDTGLFEALAVRTGLTEVAPVPVPASAWLLLSGLGGLGFMSRKRKTLGG